ncbi:MAG: endonuclease/exonuclease/phosphatase family protein [bacterium]
MKRCLLFCMILLFSSLYGQTKLTVISYNIHHGEGIDKIVDLQRIADLIKNNDADFVGLQEVDKGVERTSKINIIDSLAKLTGLYYSFYKNINYQGGEYGNAILSRYKIIADTNFHYNMIREGEQRGLLQIKVKIDDDTLVFMTTHIDYREDDTERLLNVEELIQITQKYKHTPIIVCGDFNDVPHSRTIKKMREYFIDVFSALNMDTLNTFPTETPNVKIDYIFTQDKTIKENKLFKLKILKAEVLHSTASDHLPILTQFEIIK